MLYCLILAQSSAEKSISASSFIPLGSKPCQEIEFFRNGKGAQSNCSAVRIIYCCHRGLWFSSQHLHGYSKRYVQFQGLCCTLGSMGTRHTCAQIDVHAGQTFIHTEETVVPGSSSYTFRFNWCRVSEHGGHIFSLVIYKYLGAVAEQWIPQPIKIQM